MKLEEAFGEYTDVIWKMICQKYVESERINIKFDIYKYGNLVNFSKSRR